MICLLRKAGCQHGPGRQGVTRAFTLCLALLSLSAAVQAAEDRIRQGEALATSRAKGNCLACHAIADGELAGNIGPPLLAMQARFPDRDRLFRQIWDATERNPDSRMPPFGRHGILMADEIELIMDYLYTL